MNKIIYEGEIAILSFDYVDVINALSRLIEECSVEEDSLLKRWLQDVSTEGSRNIKIDGEDRNEELEFIDRIPYVIKQLLSDKKGNVFCKDCSRDIPAAEITKNQTSPFDHYKGIDKKMIKRGVRLPGGEGGTHFVCCEGHILISTMDWLI